jgi:hypothetical protein
VHNEELRKVYASPNKGAAEWIPTFLKVIGKGVVGIGRRERWPLV